MNASSATSSPILPHHMVSQLHQRDVRRVLLSLHSMLPTDDIPWEYRSRNCKDAGKYVPLTELWKQYVSFHGKWLTPLMLLFSGLPLLCWELKITRQPEWQHLWILGVCSLFPSRYDSFPSSLAPSEVLPSLFSFKRKCCKRYCILLARFNITIIDFWIAWMASSKVQNNNWSPCVDAWTQMARWSILTLYASLRIFWWVPALGNLIHVM